MTDQTVTIDHIRAAAQRLAPHVLRTPLLRSRALDTHVGGTVFAKAECLQNMGSFKIRGALNRILQLTDEERAAGVVAFSSGNHAQGVAKAAAIAGVSSTIVMPEDAPVVKAERTRQAGAIVVTYDRYNESREEIAKTIAKEKGAVLVPPFDDPRIIAGQGTVGLEIAEALKERGEAIDQVLVCCSGGGLSAGVGLALRDAFPDIDIMTVEPDGFDDVKKSLAAGEIKPNAPGASSICDALLLPAPGALTFDILQRLGARGVSVSDDQVMETIRFAAEHLRVVVEPGGAVALAAARHGLVDTRGKRTAVVLSGGNIDTEILRRALGAGA